MVGVAVLAAALLLRYAALEAGVFPLDCAGAAADGIGGLCAAKWLLVQSFLHQRLGWLSFVLGLAAFATRRRGLAWAGWGSGIAGLVLYSFDPAAIGALLSLLVLARAASQRRRGEEQPGEEPRDGLGVGGLG
ncbi:MAG: hypothetical protein ROZ37_08065 [Aromatoleum sp.]|uniref:hypothetical protein n=1 Tax=Aromatoleum sp. TaxID=2307007 RepID=UPI00289505F7|nr:hypothetical protein [Aromatoleum sp.]MDT3670276.1 hypothetical protein [Aromatoleum sp.]